MWMTNMAQMSSFWFFMFLLWPWMSATATAATTSVAKPDCPDKCGNITVPYPFGIGNSDCAFNNFFLLTCNETSTPAKLIFGLNILVRSVSAEEGTMVARLGAAHDCLRSSGQIVNVRVNFRLGGGPFRFSDTRNMLTAFGCDTVALMRDRMGNFGSGCISLCNQNRTVINGCSGFGCSQTSVPQSLKTLNISIGSQSNHTNLLNSNPCGYAFLTDIGSFTVEGMRLSYYPQEIPSSYSVLQWSNEEGSLFSNSVIEWVVEEKTCEDAQKNMTTYACRENSACDYSENGQGYRCLCKEGFTGNPYLEGCQDIDECKDPKTYPCHGTCKNTVGNYTCRCPLGMNGDGKVGCQGFRVTSIAAVVGAVTLGVIISVLIVIICNRRKKEKNFLENGGMLLKHQRVRIFSEKELAKATKDYDQEQFLGEGGFGSVFKGVLPDNTQIAVKKPKKLDKVQLNQEFQHEIGVVSQVNHKNVVKLLGLCLETKVPLLVYEFISNGNLYEHIHDKKSPILTNWENRLKIAAETALALDYLHSLADPPIIHGDVKSMNILLDDNFTAKVSDFGASVLISPDQADIATRIQGTFGYLDPEYLMTGILTAKSDVYSFGVVLVELLTGEKPNPDTKSGQKSNIMHYFLASLDDNKLSEILCFEVTGDTEMDEVEAFAEIAKQCLNTNRLKRPAMRVVAEELARLTKLHENLWGEKSSEETEHLLGEASYCSVDIETVMNRLPDSFSITSFDTKYPVDSV